MNPYEQAEQQGEQIILQIAPELQLSKIHFTPLYCSYDIKAISANTTYIIGEIKKRKVSVSTTLKYCPWLEKTKLKGMLEAKDELAQKGIDVVMIYFSECTDGMVVYQLGELDSYIWNDKWLPISSVENRGKKMKIIADLVNPVRIIIY